MGDTSPSKKFKLDQALDETADDLIATKALFKAYQRGELSTSILSRDEQPHSSVSIPQPPSTSSSCRQPKQSCRPQTATTNMSEKPLSSGNEDNEPSGQPVMPTSPSKRSNTACLLVNARQRGNPILKFIRNVAWEFVEMEPDYVMGRNTCALYLSLRYHNFNPNYIDGRIQKLGRSYELRILLVQVDVTEPYAPLKELTRVSILTNMTLMLAWTAEEAGRYLESYKALENKPADLIKEKMSTDFLSQAEDFLTSIRSVNKTDTATLLTHFGSMEAIMKAEVEELSSCPGLGVQKKHEHSFEHTEASMFSPGNVTQDVDLPAEQIDELLVVDKARRIYEIFRTPFPRASR